MKYRQTELLGLTAKKTSDGVETIDIDLADPISEIYLDLRVTNGLVAASTAPPLAAFTKIEIVDGSEVIFNLTGMCAQAVDIYNSGIHPRGGWFNYLQNTETDIKVALQFGRFLMDPLLALDPKQFRNLQLKISYDYDAGGCNPSGVKLAVQALCFDGKVPSLIGYLATKEIKSWSGTAGAINYTDLPVDFPYRKLFYQGYKSGSPPHWIGNNIKLSEDQDKKVVFDNNFRELMFGIGRENAFIRENLTTGGETATRIKHVTPTMDVMASFTQWRNALVTAEIAAYDGDGGALTVDCASANSVAGHVAGWAPHGVLCLPFGLQGDIEDWYDVNTIGNLKGTVLGGVTTTTEKWIAQQLRRY